jgi:hypothetical protein
MFTSISNGSSILSSSSTVEVLVQRKTESQNNYVAAPLKQLEPSNAKFFCNKAQKNDSCYVSYVMATAEVDVAGDDTATTGASNASNEENNFDALKGQVGRLEDVSDYPFLELQQKSDILKTQRTF